VRETLFNWLAPHIVNAACLDLFAGSGALGFEAISRGAESVVMVEQNPLCIKALQENMKIFGSSHIDILHATALTWLSENTQDAHRYNIIFLDPPYQSNLLEESIHLIIGKNLLAPSGWIYCESDKSIDSLDFPKSLEIYRHKKAGQVYYGLVKINDELI
jgi:16S rRNA (guanine966-N2)-methyltransferase